MKITPVHYRVLVRLFEKAGWIYARTKGDHLVYEKYGFLRPVVIPKYKTVPTFVIKNNLRTARISREDYFELL
ncbi:MAG: YcfA family protein [Microgenomates group bacterium GW2011_GWA2_47_8]|nr:MAG: YcfA family protein [Microgenomates group bacterium GW2011_GWA2_47_8]